jgi:outer membrane biosynthesis protein TonB
MPITEAPTNVSEPTPNGPAGTSPAPPPPEPDLFGTGAPDPDREPAAPVVRGSRWVDYDTHELLEMISELEDERRWARLREGIWIAVLLHILVLSAITWIPKYVFNVAPVIDPIDAIRQRKDLTYLDTPDALRQLERQQPKVVIKPVPPRQPVIDRKTLEAMNRAAPPAPAPAPAPEPAPAAAAPAAAPIQPVDHPPLEAPRPAAVPARPNFALGSQNPADQLRDAMKGASRNSGPGVGQLPMGGLARHPGAGGGVEILSDQQGVDFSNWILRWHRETETTWDPLIPDEVNPPIMKAGTVVIRFKVLPNGRLMDGSVQLEGRSGDTALDRAAWGALTGSNYPPLPREFHGPYLELRAIFMYNMEPK